MACVSFHCSVRCQFDTADEDDVRRDGVWSWLGCGVGHRVELYVVGLEQAAVGGKESTKEGGEEHVEEGGGGADYDCEAGG